MTEEPNEPTPILFRVVLVAAALYLLLRFVQGIAWVVERLR
jgi:hypothetical protein